MRFIADSMLGRLSRWLRLLGYDTLYFPRIEDSVLLRISREQGRVLLTRDSRLVRVRGLKDYLLLRENDPFRQLRKVLETFQLRPAESTAGVKGYFLSSRCSDCNSVLTTVTREEVKGSVPEYVYETSRVFRQCGGCGKLYWDGTHPGKFMQKLSEALGP